MNCLAGNNFSFLRASLGITAILFLLSITACNPCKNTNCQNNGECTEGECSCPSPYGGANCETNLCTGIDCGNNGNCYYGKCECEAGYEGTQCEKLVTAKFVGSFYLTGNCDGVFQGHVVSIWASGIVSSKEIIVQPILGTSIHATVNGRAISIASTPVGNTTCHGSGSISENGKQIQLNILVAASGSNEAYTCEYVLNR